MAVFRGKISLIMTLTLGVILAPSVLSGADALPPVSPVKLIFIHHSTGGNWLADLNPDEPYGGLGAALRDNNYYVSATNYGWGPNSVGDRTDIPNWPEWFTGEHSSGILSVLYAENGQNVGEFGPWSRLAAEVAGENEIILFKSCFPNSDLFGGPDDPPAAEPNDWEYSVGNAKAVYNHLLTYFATRPDKLFVVITAPPQVESAYPSDPLTAPAVRAANARSFNRWLVNTWLEGCPHNNVAVFDYFNVLTHPDNHHRVVGGAIEHITSSQSGNFAYYPAGDGDSHPNTAGHRKATLEFAPLLNLFYNTWKGAPPSVSKPAVTTGAAGSIDSGSATLTGTVNPNGAETTYHFEYGLTTVYGANTPTLSAGAGSSSVAVNMPLPGLPAKTTYHYRLVAANSEGTTRGDDATFTTSDTVVIFGNVDGSPDGKVTLSDAIVALKICAGLTPAGLVSAAEVDGDRRIGLAEAVYALQKIADLRDAAALVQPSDLTYLGAFRLPDAGERPLTFEYGGNAMSFNPDGGPSSGDAHPGSLFIMGHDRLPYGELSDGGQVAEISIPAPAMERDPENLPQAGFIQNFQNVLQGRFTDMEEIPKVGMQYLNHPDTGPKIHVCWGQHLQPEDAASHGWINANLAAPAFQGSWFIGNQNLYSVNGYLLDIPAAWANRNVNGRYLATGRMRDGGQGGMGPALFAYRPWLSGGAAPGPGARLEESVLLRYGDVALFNPNERSMKDYQHPDEWEGGAWITTPSGKSALLFAGTKATGTKYWYGYRDPRSPEHPCVDTHVTDIITCRTADGNPCPPEDFNGCCDETDETEETCISARGWWSTRFDAQLILYNPEDLARVAAGTMSPWEPQPYATIDIDEHLYLDPPVWDEINVGAGVQRRYRIGDAAYDRNQGFLYVLELYADGAKPVVHVWKVL